LEGDYDMSQWFKEKAHALSVPPIPSSVHHQILDKAIASWT